MKNECGLRYGDRKSMLGRELVEGIRVLFRNGVFFWDMVLFYRFKIEFKV